MWDRKKKVISTSQSKIQWYVDNGFGSEIKLRSIQHQLNQLRAEVDNYLLTNSVSNNLLMRKVSGIFPCFRPILFDVHFHDLIFERL